jgi:hypothetical protein
MKRALLLTLAVTLFASSGLYAQKKLKPSCAVDLAHCSEQGCGGQFDPHLNETKNITANNGTSTVQTLQFIQGLHNPETFREGDTREELKGLGEGNMVTVAAYVIAVKPELSGESCNCGLHKPEETDNHLVLVTSTTVDSFAMTGSVATQKTRFHSRELQSTTAEFTPRVRLTHPNFTDAFVQPFINKTTDKALFVRVTGPLLFDSEHFLHNGLVRVNDWEIHPILKFEICMSGSAPATTCKPGSDAGWKSVDDM